MKPVKTVEKVSLVCSWLVLTVFVLANPVLAQVELKSVIPIPGFVDFSNPASLHAASFDIGWVSRGKYYFTDRGPTATAYGDCHGRVTVIDASDNTLEPPICGFVGNLGTGVSGPNGLLVIPAVNELWAGDGDSTVKVVDPQHAGHCGHNFDGREKASGRVGL